MTDDRSAVGADQSTDGLGRLGKFNAALDRVVPHLLWFVGAYMMVDAIWLQRTTAAMVDEPRAVLLVHGFLLFSAGRSAVGWMKKQRD